MAHPGTCPGNAFKCFHSCASVKKARLCQLEPPGAQPQTKSTALAWGCLQCRERRRVCCNQNRSLKSLAVSVGHPGVCF